MGPRPLVIRDLHGLRRLYYRPEGVAAPRLRELVRAGEDGLDPLGVGFAFGEIAETDRTWIEGIRRVPRGASRGSSDAALVRSVTLVMGGPLPPPLR